MSFAGALKDAVAVIFNWDRELLEGSTKASREWREEIDTWWAERLGIPNLTPRWVLQQWGTDVARKNFHNDIWVASVENRLRGIKDDIVITDCRFANEVHAIKSAGGVTLRTHRGADPIWLEIAELHTTADNDKDKTYFKDLLEQNHDVHASEYSSIGLDYDYHIDNTGTIDHLHKQMESVINR
jgi:hypothetical protein